MQDFALNRVRPLFATLPGVSAPPPFGGNQRTIVITLNPDKLQQYGISPDEALAAVTKASLVMPSGNIATGTLNRIARTNAALGGNLPELLSTPIRPGAGTTVYLRDIGTIENGTDLITAYAHVNGRRTVYIPVTKRADASTLSVINAVKAAIPDFKKAVPDDVDVRLEFDQSPYVRNSIRGLVVEGLLGAALTGLMVLIFLRDWRSALIVILNIPFALLSAVILLWATGQTINIMTLGRPGAGRGRSGGRGDRGDREHPHADAARRLARARRGGGLQPHGHGAAALHVLHSGGLRALVLYGRRGTPALCAALSGGGVFDDRVLPAVEQPGAGLLHVADEGGPSRRGEGRTVRLPAQVLFRLSRRASCDSDGRWCWAIWPAAAVLLVILLPHMGTEIFPDVDAPILRIRLRAPAGTRVEETERQVLRALDVD